MPKDTFFLPYWFLSMDYENMSSVLKAQDKTNRSGGESREIAQEN